METCIYKGFITHKRFKPIKHFFMDGVYVREMTMYRGTVVVGAIHKDLHMCFLLKGHLTIASKDGAKDYIAPCYIIAEPGTRRVLYSHEDSVWYNTHRNPEGLEKIEDIELPQTVELEPTDQELLEEVLEEYDLDPDTDTIH